MQSPVRILYFAWVREFVGLGEEELVLPHEVADLAALVAWLKARSPNHARAFSQPGEVRAAVNQVLARGPTPVGAGDEIAFFPPITGG